jgi:hypothetical protein
MASLANATARAATAVFVKKVFIISSQIISLC